MRIATPDEVARMPWHARAKYDARLRAFYASASYEDLLAAENDLARRQAPPARRKRARERVKIRRLPDGWWEMTNGHNTALFPTAQAAWALLAQMDRAA